MPSKTFSLSAANTFAAVLVYNDDSKLLSRLGHDHVIRADHFASSIELDPDDLASLSFTLEFLADALVVDDDDDRARMALGGPVSSHDRDKTRDNMLGRGQLNTKKHKTITFEVNGATHQADHTWHLHAALTICGTRHGFDFPVDLTLDNGLTVSGRVDLSHAHFGLKPYKAPMGALKNRDKLTFVVDANLT